MRSEDVVQLFRALAWPAIALVALIMFFAPLRRGLDAVSARADPIKSVRIGQLDLTLDPNALPGADLETARALKNMDELALLVLLDTKYSPASEYCHSRQGGGSWARVATDLEARGLVTARRQNPPRNPEACDWDIVFQPTPLGLKSRDFAAQLLATLLKTSTRS